MHTENIGTWEKVTRPNRSCGELMEDSVPTILK